jgi:hypothetical protein
VGARRGIVRETGGQVRYSHSAFSSTDSIAGVGSVSQFKLLSEIQAEIYRHDFNTFVDEPPSVAQGGRGVVVLGASAQAESWGGSASATIRMLDFGQQFSLLASM